MAALRGVACAGEPALLASDARDGQSVASMERAKAGMAAANVRATRHRQPRAGQCDCQPTLTDRKEVPQCPSTPSG
jgi:hypothetical protein